MYDLFCRGGGVVNHTCILSTLAIGFLWFLAVFGVSSGEGLPGPSEALEKFPQSLGHLRFALQLCTAAETLNTNTER